MLTLGDLRCLWLESIRAGVANDELPLKDALYAATAKMQRPVLDNTAVARVP